jgi:2-polyprenyl-3-methyl-5-hydroxy-6-metoxy-1,4-benzoquinol methylase
MRTDDPAASSAAPVGRSSDDLDPGEAIVRVALALRGVERAYAIVRFAILRHKLLTILDLLLPSAGRILDVGCGFGLWSSYFALMAPRRSIVGLDVSERRISVARDVQRRLGLGRNTYVVGTAESAEVEGKFDGIVVLDVLHHLPKEQQRPTLLRLRSLLAAGGVLLIKDITTDSSFRLKFTEILDRVMVGFDEPLAYRHHHEWADELASLGFTTRVVRVSDVLPYPHVVIVARLAEPTAADS